MKINLQKFAEITNRREDANKEVEGITVGGYVDLTLYKQTLFVPGVSMTERALTDSGTLVLSTLNGSGASTVTDLCVAGTPTDLANDSVPISITKKVSERFYGCFEIAGIADQNILDGQNNARVKMMANGEQNYAYDVLTNGGTVSTLADFVVGTDVASSYFANRVLEYKKLNGYAPTVALVSYEFANEIAKEVSLRQTSLGDEALVNGYIGGLQGVTFIEADIDQNLILMTAESLIRIYPTNALQLAHLNVPQATIINSGMSSLSETDAPSGIEYTWLHRYFEYAVVNAKSVTISATPAVTP